MKLYEGLEYDDYQNILEFKDSNKCIINCGGGQTWQFENIVVNANIVYTDFNQTIGYIDFEYYLNDNIQHVHDANDKQYESYKNRMVTDNKPFDDKKTHLLRINRIIDTNDMQLIYDGSAYNYILHVLKLRVNFHIDNRVKSIKGPYSSIFKVKKTFTFDKSPYALFLPIRDNLPYTHYNNKVSGVAHRGASFRIDQHITNSDHVYYELS